MKRQHNFTLLICALCLLAQPLRAQTELTTGASLNGELKANEKHSYQLKLAANQAAHIVVTQRGADVLVSVYDPAGRLLAEVDSPNGSQGTEPVWIANQPAGAYRVEVTLFEGEQQRPVPGKYEIKLETLRAATAQDAKTGQAQSALTEARRMLRGKRGGDDAVRKAAGAKLAEAARVLGKDGDPALTQAVRQALLNNAPQLRLQELKLTKVPGAVTVYHSADNGPLAKDVAARFASLGAFYQPQLKRKPEFTFAMLNKADWTELSGGAPFGIPLFTPDPPTMLASSDLQPIAGMLSMFKGKVTPELNSALAAEGLSYEANGAPLVIEAGAGIMVGMWFVNEMLEPLPKPWMQAVLGTYLLHAWLGDVDEPRQARAYRLGMRIPGVVMTPATRGLDAMFSSPDMFTQGVVMSRACDLGAQLYDTHKLGLLAELQKAFPKGEKVAAAEAEARLFKLSPHFKPWVESFNLTGAALEVRQAEEALVALRKAKDGAAFERAVADEYCGLNQFGQQRNKAGFRMSATQPTPVAVFNLDRTDIEVSGDLAIVRGAQTEQWAGGPLEHHLFTRIWIKRAGRWQLLSNTQFIDPNKK